MNLNLSADASERIRYEDPSVPIYVARGDLRSLSGMSALCHWHPEVELLLPLKGHLSYMIDGRKLRIDEGQTLFVNTRRMHYGFSEDGTDCEYLCIVFDPLILSGSEEIKNRYVLPILSDMNFSFLLIESEGFCAMLRELDAAWRNRASGDELLVVGQLLQIWRSLWAQAAAAHDGLTPIHDNTRILREMLSYIRLHYEERLSLQSVAAAGGVCRSKCCRLFKEYLHQTPNDYLNSLRLEHAAELLRETRMGITEIALSCGFHSGSYFTELFSRQKGCTPTAFRQQDIGV